MKLLNIDSKRRSIWIGDIGNNRNGGIIGRRHNQARYIPTSWDDTIPIPAIDPTKYVQLIETGAVKKSAVDGDIAGLVSEGLIQILSVGDNVERTLSVTKTGAPVLESVKFFDDNIVFGRAVLVTKLKVELPVAVSVAGGAKTVKFNFRRETNDQTSATFDMVGGSPTAGPTYTFDVSAMTFADTNGNAWAYNETLGLDLDATAGGQTVGLTSIKVTITYELVD